MQMIYEGEARRDLDSQIWKLNQVGLNWGHRHLEAISAVDRLIGIRSSSIATPGMRRVCIILIQSLGYV